MADEFLNWLLFDVILKFGEWFVDTLFSAYRAFVLILTFPIWGIPFGFWYFRVYKPQQEEQQGSYSEIPNNTWKQQTMSRFERVE